jgi:molybdopterin biosynthesis enzyme
LPNHHSIDAAIAWVETVAHSLDAENVPPSTARERVLTEHIRAVEPTPAVDRAAVDGFAVQASASLGASAYTDFRNFLDARVSCIRDCGKVVRTAY